MENLVLSNDTTGKSTHTILTEITNQILAFDVEQLKSIFETKEVEKPKNLIKKIQSLIVDAVDDHDLADELKDKVGGSEITKVDNLVDGLKYVSHNTQLITQNSK